MILALSLSCLFTTLIWVVVVAIVVALVLWIISYTEVPFPPIVTKLIVVLAVIICVWLVVSCLVTGKPPSIE